MKHCGFEPGCWLAQDGVCLPSQVGSGQYGANDASLRVTLDVTRKALESKTFPSAQLGFRRADSRRVLRINRVLLVAHEKSEAEAAACLVSSWPIDRS